MTRARRISAAEKYLRDVADGKLVVNKRIKQLAEMMLPRFDDGYKRWHFDIDKAERPIRFIEKFCMLPSGKLGVPFVLEPYERLVIELAFGFVDEDGIRQFQEILVVWARKNGKALDIETPIPTPDGWKKMEDIHPGDYVFGKDGQPVEVLLESELFYKPMYRVTFEDGETIDASADHVWTVQTKCSRRKLPKRSHDGGWFETTTEEMAENVLAVRKDGKGVEYRYRVPMNGAAEYPEANLPIHPYMLGVWLGDGTSTKPEVTTCADDMDEMISLIEDCGYPVRVRNHPSDAGKAPTLQIDHRDRGTKAAYDQSSFRNKLNALGVLGNKHIPDSYMHASVEQRWELLKGLMDTDGTCSKTGQCEFTQKSELLATQLVYLCASLGIKATIHEKRATCSGKDAGLVYRVQFFTDKEHSCFKMARKHARLKDQLSPRMSAKSIVSIEKIETKPSKCIMVDDPWHLYLAGKHYTPTHNPSLGAAIELYMLIADGEGAPQVYNVATSKDQASLAYGAVIKMMRQSPELSKVVRKGTVVERDQDGIVCDRTMGYITPLTSQTRHLDGLDVHFCLFDEMAASTNRDQYDLIKQAMSARTQPMIMAITTNGFERENLFDDQYDYACGILDGKIEDDRMLPIIYELDDRSEWTDDRMWVKANPGLGTVKSWDYMKDAVNKGMQDPSFLPTLMTKDFNMPESRAAAWLTFDEATNEETFDISEMGFRYGIAGFDASDTTDLSAAKMLMMRPDDPKIYELSMYWLPEDALNYGDGYRRERDDVPYKQWVERGLMRTVPGNTVPKRVFLDWLEEIKLNLDVYTFAIGYDPWHIIGQDEEALQQYVGKERCIAVRQGPKTLSAPMKQFRAQLAGNLVVDNHNPINEWCRMNTSVKSDVNANIQPVKMQGKAKNRIDGFMAELCAYVAMMLHKEEYEANL